MTTPYTYLLTHRITGKRYYGVRYANGCHPSELWVKYFSSSKAVKSLERRDFDFEVRKTFKTGEEAYLWEQKVLLRLKVWKNDRWLNQGFNGKHFCHTKGRIPSEETKKKMAAPQKGRPKSEEAKRKMSEYWSGRPRKPLSEETKRKIGAKNAKNMLGKKPSAESIAKRSKTLTGKKRKPFSDEHRKNMSLSRIGKSKPMSDLHKAALKEAWVKRKADKLLKLNQETVQSQDSRE